MTTTPQHPLDPLTPEEITLTSFIINKTHQSPNSWIFNSITLKEPPKSLLIETIATNEQPSINYRKSFTILIEKSTGIVYEVTVNLIDKLVEKFEKQELGLQPTLTPEDCFDAERICKLDGDVIGRIESLGLKIENVVGDPWSIGYNGEVEFENYRIVQLFMYFKNFEGDNHYAHPLDFVVVVDLTTQSVIKIEDLPTQNSSFKPNGSSVPLQTKNSNYDPEIIGKDNLRKDVKPLEVIQPEGPSYIVNGNEVYWQNFRFRVGFNYREGLTLHNVTYKDGENIRPLFYRMSLSEMVVPYGDPRPPFHRKCAYDIGDYGLGFCTNNLKLACDCLGTIKYFQATLNNHEGSPVIIPNAVCLHEEDSGILQKHTEYRNNHVVVTRSRRLVISFIATVVNYEYAFYWYFYQDGNISFEVKATGELSTNLVNDGNHGDYVHGTIVFPGVLAQYHQHIFCVRLDPIIDGINNLISSVDVVRIDKSDDLNPYGQGFKIESNLVDKYSDREGTRTWRISNPNVLNEYTKEPVGWLLVPGSNPSSLLAGEGSWIRERARFATHSVWVCGYKEDELFAGGYYINQSKKSGGVVKWVEEEEEGDCGEKGNGGRDVVLFHSFGVTHIPTVENFPIMSVETTGFSLKPSNFFNRNPGVDVPPQALRNSRSKIAEFYLGVANSNGCC